MKRVIFSVILLSAASVSFAQIDSTNETKKQMPNLATIHTMEGKILTGWFYRLDDDHVFLLPYKRKKLSTVSFADPGIADKAINIDVEQIQSISLHKKNSELKGFVIGLAAGTAIGAFIGFVSGDTHGDSYNLPVINPFSPFYSDPAMVFVDHRKDIVMSAGRKALLYGAFLGTTSALIGTIIGLAQEKFIMRGKKEVYRDLQGDLMKRLIVR